MFDVEGKETYFLQIILNVFLLFINTTLMYNLVYIVYKMMRLIMSSTLVSARVPDELAQRLESLAQTMHRSKSFLAAQAIEEFVLSLIHI